MKKRRKSGAKKEEGRLTFARRLARNLSPLGALVPWW
jgi:hypothetical protein